MQITRAEVIPAELALKAPVRYAGQPPIATITAVFVRLELQTGQSAWGCTVANPSLTGAAPAEVLAACRDAASLAPDLHPTNLEYSRALLADHLGEANATALCAFDLALHDLLGLASGLPLYRLLGGYRERIQTSVTVPLGSVDESVETACQHARSGFRMLKIKGGEDAGADVRRVKAIRQVLPYHTLHLDPDGGYTVAEALEVARVLKDDLEMLEQPVPGDDLAGLTEVTRHSPLPVLADQSLRGPASALELAANHRAHGLSIKLAACGGLSCARQIESIARAAGLVVMISCVIEPALLAAAGLALALSSPGVHYGDLDGFLHLASDPSLPGFRLEEGWLVALDVPGIGGTVELG